MPRQPEGAIAREAQLLNALYPLLGRDTQATQALFDIIKNQPGYWCPKPSSSGHHHCGDPKSINNLNLSVHPPAGRVTLVAPTATRLEVARAYAISRLGWIRDQQEQLVHQARKGPRQFITRESHYLWVRRYLMTVLYRDEKPGVVLDHKRITLTVGPHSGLEQRARVIHKWHRRLLHAAIPPLIDKWQERLRVEVSSYFLQRMKTKWGSCNHRAAHIRLNTELVKKPRDLLEYVIVHEMANLITPTHSDRFVAILDRHYPSWREARAHLNALPLAAENRTERA